DLGTVKRWAGGQEEALKSLATARALLEPLVPAQGPATKHARSLARMYNGTAALQAELGRPAEAIKPYAAGVALLNRLIRETETHADDAELSAQVHQHLGKAYGDRGLYEQALEAHQESRALWEDLVRRFPGEPRFDQGLAHAHHNLAVVQMDL